MPLSDTALVIVSAAAQRDDRRAEILEKLPAAARQAVARSLIMQGLLKEDGNILRLTDDGFRAINLQPPSTAQGATDGSTVVDGTNPPNEAETTPQTPHGRPVAAQRGDLRGTAQAVLAAWDARDGQPETLAEAIERLRILMVNKSARPLRAPSTPRNPREGTKQQTVLALLRRDEGASVAQIVAATAWAQHTVRGFLANLKRKGITVDVLERVRQVGPGSAGARGSYSIYRIASAG